MPLLILLLALGCDAGKADTAKDTGASEPPADGLDDPQAGCDPATAAPPPRQLRLLTRREYAATIGDLFALGGACETWEPRLDGYGDRSTVHVAGSFNDWAPSADKGGWALGWDGAAWTGRFEVEPGEHQYKFVLDEREWITDPQGAETADDGYGGVNSLLRVDCGAGVDPAALAAELPVETRPQGFPFDNDAATGLVTATHADRFLEAAARVAEAALASGTDAPWLPCGDPDDTAACAEDFARIFGRRALRRPLSEDEVGRVVDRVLDADDLEQGLSVALQIMLTSPDFLYRFEIGEPDGESWRLTEWETASALSYLFWGSAPDDALLDEAAAGGLDSPEGIEAAARRLLEDPRAGALLGTFATQWLGAEAIANAERGADSPLDDALRADMLAETADFVRHAVLEGDGTLEALLTADYTLASPALAELYGASAPGDDGVVALPAERSGILSHASVLTTTAHSDQTSPILRGLFVRERLLCQTLGTPPADAVTVPEIDPDATTRETTEQHTADPVCFSCHQYIDDVGFGFEHFDPVGRWRDTENGAPIDASGDMNDVEYLGSATTAPYGSMAELAGILVGSDALGACYTRQTWRFALGGLERSQDECALEDLELALADSGGDIRALLIALVTSDAFTTRQ